jgi:hypothetical protein
MLAEVESSNDTLQAIGQRYGITRERVRQISAIYLGISGAERINRRAIETAFTVGRGLYPEWVAATWKEAAAQGIDVKAWRNGQKLLTRALFFNSRRMWLMHTTHASRTSIDAQRLYARVNIHRRGSHIVVVDNPLDNQRSFYIYPQNIQPLRLMKTLYIPLNESLYPNISQDIDHAKFKNAWHLLKEPNHDDT